MRRTRLIKMTALVVTALASGGLGLFAQAEGDPEEEMWRELAAGASSVGERMGYVHGVEAESPAPAWAPAFYAEVLEDLLRSYPGLRTSQDRADAEKGAADLIDALVEAGYGAAAGSIWRVTTVFSSPSLKARALRALGQLRSVEYLPQVIQVLNEQNSGVKGSEEIAYGAIVSLESYGDSSGYTPVFQAAAGWYTRRTRERAQAALSTISADPTEILLEILRSISYDAETKCRALLTAASEESGAPEARKAEVAVEALRQGLGTRTSDPREQGYFYQLRKQALEMLRDYPDPAALSLLDQCYTRGADVNEKLNAIGALAALDTDAAVVTLAGYLTLINQEYQSGKSPVADTDLRLVRALILALRASSASGDAAIAQRRALLTIQMSSPWPAAIRELCK